MKKIGRVLRIGKRNGWIQGLYESPKSKKLNHFRSSWELKLFKFLDNCNEVKSWESECVKIPYRLGKRVKWYVPDVLINGELLLEIKPKHQINWKINKAKFESALVFCKNRNWRFKIITKELLNPFYLMEEIKKLKK